MKIKLLTPVHIGTGEEIPLHEWKVDSRGNHWVRIDWLNLPFLLFPSDETLRNFDELKSWCEESLSWEIASEHKMYEAQVAPGVSLPTEGTEIFRECMKNQSTLEPIIPGSSLKGAILTGYLYSGYESQGKFERGPYGEKKLRKNAWGELRNFSRGANNPVSDFSHRLKVSDIVFPQSTLRIDLAERRMKKAGNQYQWLECIAAGNVGTARISLGIEYDTNNEIAPQMRSMRKSDIEKLVKRSNNFAKAVIKAELDYYDYCISVKGYEVTLPDYYREYDVNFDRRLSEMECLVRVGWGSSKNAVSVVLLNSKPNLKYQPPPKSPSHRPKSRWLLSGNIPLGWCSVKFKEGDWLE